MMMLTNTAASQWMAKCLWTLDGCEVRRLPPEPTATVGFRIADDPAVAGSGGAVVVLTPNRVVPIARGFASWLFESDPDECLLWAREYGIWNSSENLPLYYVWRRSHHDFDLLSDAAAHLFQRFEKDEVLTLIELCLLSGWGFVAATPERRAVSINHDGGGMMVASTSELLAASDWILGTH